MKNLKKVPKIIRFLLGHERPQSNSVATTRMFNYNQIQCQYSYEHAETLVDDFIGKIVPERPANIVHIAKIELQRFT